MRTTLLRITAVIALFASGLLAGEPNVITQFTGSIGGLLGSNPPDTMMAVGPGDIMESNNNGVKVFTRNGGLLFNSNLKDFWVNTVGIAGADRPFDTRVMYDATAGRFYAVGVDFRNDAANSRIYVGVSQGVSALGPWRWGLIMANDPANLQQRWADFPTLGYNNLGIYISTANLSIDPPPNPDPGAATSIFVIPKTLALAGGAAMNLDGDNANVNMRNAKYFRHQSIAQTGQTVQPVAGQDPIGAAQPQSLFSAHTGIAGGPVADPAAYKRLQIDGNFANINTLTLNTAPGANMGKIAGDVYSDPLPAPQPYIPDFQGAPQKNALNAGDTRLSSTIVEQSVPGEPGLVWTVQGVFDPGTQHDAIRMAIIDKATDTIKAEKLFHATDADFYYPSIGVNLYGDFVIGCTVSSPDNEASLAASAYALTGKYENGQIALIDNGIIALGDNDFQRLDARGRNRWGDYSATMVDPENPYSFWTIQEVCLGDDVWHTIISQIVVPEPGGAVLAVMALLALTRRHARA